MIKRWSIFLVSNILEMAIFLFSLFLEFYRAQMSVGNIIFDNYWALFIFLLVVGVIMTNCITNIYLTKVLTNKDLSIKPKFVFFWIITVLFLIILFLLSLGAFSEYSEIKNPQNINNTALKVVFILQIFIIVNGLFILYNQIALRRLIWLQSKKAAHTIIQQIGSSFN